MTKKESNSKKILIIMLIAPLLILSVALLIINKNNLSVKPINKKDKSTVTVVPSQPITKGNAKLLLEPNNGSPLTEDVLSVDVFVDSGNEEIVSVDIGLEFDSNKLEYLNIEENQSKFSQIPNLNKDKGKLVITGFVTPPNALTGKQIIAKVNFKVLNTTGNTSITFTKNSADGTSPKSAVYAKLDGNNIWDQVTAGGTYTLSK